MMEYNKENLERMRIKLNIKDYSSSWLRKHFREMLNILYEQAKEKES